MGSYLDFYYKGLNTEIAIDFNIDLTRKKAKRQKDVNTLNATTYIDATYS